MDESINCAFTGAVIPHSKGENHLNLICMKKIWIDLATRDAPVFLVVLFPSGIPGSDDGEAESDDGPELHVKGLELVLSVKYPSMMTRVTELCALRLQ